MYVQLNSVYLLEDRDILHDVQPPYRWVQSLVTALHQRLQTPYKRDFTFSC